MHYRKRNDRVWAVGGRKQGSMLRGRHLAMVRPKNSELVFAALRFDGSRHGLHPPHKLRLLFFVRHFPTQIHKLLCENIELLQNYQKEQFEFHRVLHMSGHPDRRRTAYGVTVSRGHSDRRRTAHGVTVSRVTQTDVAQRIQSQLAPRQTSHSARSHS